MTCSSSGRTSVCRLASHVTACSEKRLNSLTWTMLHLEGGFDDVDCDVEDEGQCEHASVPEEDI